MIELVQQAYDQTNYGEAFGVLFYRYCGNEALILILKGAGHTTSFLMGSSFLNSFIMLVPRALWEHKPLALGFQFTDTFTPGEYGDRMVSTPTTLPGELYWDLSWVGTAVGMMIIGVFVRTVDEFRRQHQSATRVLLCLPLVYFAGGVNEGDIGGQFTVSSLYFIIALWIAIRLITVKAPRQPGSESLLPDAPAE